MATRLETKKLISALRKLSKEKGKNLWKRVAEELEKPRRVKKRWVVNVGELKKKAYAENKIILIPHKLLGKGNVDKPYKVIAFSFSEKAKEKIEKAGGTILSLSDFIKEKNIRENEIIIIK